MNEKTKNKLIHVGFILEPGQGITLLFLRQVQPFKYQWFIEEATGEMATDLSAPTIEEALRLAHQFWKKESFRTLICGFRYTLPERDEHGTNALFSQMADSYSSMTGVYFDEELSYNCVVHNASAQALSLLRQLRQENRLS